MRSTALCGKTQLNQMTPTDKFWGYLLPILEKTRQAHGVVYITLSDADRLDRYLSDQRSEAVYPGVFVIRPEYRGSMADQANSFAQFQTKLYVFCAAKADDFKNQDDAYQLAEQICADVVRDIQHDAFLGKCEFSLGNTQWKPFIYMSTDSAVGYELEFRIGIWMNDIFC